MADPIVCFLVVIYWTCVAIYSRRDESLSLICATPLALVGLPIAWLSLGVLTFCRSLAEAVALSTHYLPVNLIIAALRGATCGFIRIDMLPR
jgi:hypothetical protein